MNRPACLCLGKARGTLSEGKRWHAGVLLPLPACGCPLLAISSGGTPALSSPVSPISKPSKLVDGTAEEPPKETRETRGRVGGLKRQAGEIFPPGLCRSYRTTETAGN